MMEAIELRSGRKIYANKGILGIDAELQPTEGYDSTLYDLMNTFDDADEVPEEERCSKEDRLEIADIALARWTAFRDKVLSEE